MYVLILKKIYRIQKKTDIVCHTIHNFIALVNITKPDQFFDQDTKNLEKI